MFWSLSAAYLYSTEEEMDNYHSSSIEERVVQVESDKTKWLVPVSWVMYSDIEVEADSPQEAIKMVEQYKEKTKDYEDLDMEIMSSGLYLQDSLEVETDEGLVIENTDHE